MRTTINNNTVIVINGSGGVGKSSFVEFCNQINPKVMETSIIKFSKEIATYCGWEGTKSEKDRKFLSDLQDALTEWDDIPYKNIQKFIMSCKNKIIFIHIRNPETIKRIKEEFNAVTLIIKNNNVCKIKSNHADANVECYLYDYTIFNNSDLKELKNKAKDFMNLIIKGNKNGNS